MSVKELEHEKLIQTPASKKVTPFMAQYLEVKEKHQDKLVLFRMGDFYEMFYDDAKNAASILGITLTARDAKSDNPTPMAGIPHHALNDYLPKLIEAELKVAICDQVEDPAQAKGIVRREVVRIVTRGTLTEEALLKPGKNNYLMALAEHKKGVWLAYLDLSTGEVFIRQVLGQRLLDVLNSIAPTELIYSRSFEKTSLAAEIKQTIQTAISTLDDWNFSLKVGLEKVSEVYGITSSDGLGIQQDSGALKPLGALLEYVSQTQMTKSLHLRKVQTLQSNQYMILDRQTCKNLELFQNQQDGSSRGTLYESLNQTATPMGSRRLGMWMSQPLLKREDLEERLESVQAFVHLGQRQKFFEIMSGIKDLERPLGRIRCGRYSARDMKSLGISLKEIPSLNYILMEDSYLANKKMKELNELSKKILDTLKDELPLGIQDGEMIQDGVSEELDSWREIRFGGQSYLNELQERLKVEHEIPGLKVRHNKVFGYYIEVPKAQSSRVPSHFIRKQTLVNAERYIIEELKTFEDKIFSAHDKIVKIELDILTSLCEETLEHRDVIMEIAEGLSQLDVLCTFSNLSKKYMYTKPSISESPKLCLEQSRHPVVERLLGIGEFSPNGIDLEHDLTRMMLITGPNMSGKSTYIRQIGLIQIMFQMGCFVPADHAVLSLVDRVFTRVGAGDDLMSGRSTFMVEMNETANILHNATPRSLVILDEVGRGTSTLDGLSLAWAITEELHHRKELSSLCLFATHYHEMTELEQHCTHLRNFQVKVEEAVDKIIFLHQIVEGGADKSYGIHVAKLAGLPDSVIKRAKTLLQTFETPNGENEKLDLPPIEDEPFALFSMPSSDQALKEKISEIEPDEITPLQALIFLKELKEFS